MFNPANSRKHNTEDKRIMDELMSNYHQMLLLCVCHTLPLFTVTVSHGGAVVSGSSVCGGKGPVITFCFLQVTEP